jgi:hypothetical protein
MGSAEPAWALHASDRNAEALSRRDVLDALAARASSDPYFLGSALAASQQRHDLDDVALATALNAFSPGGTAC